MYLILYIQQRGIYIYMMFNLMFHIAIDIFLEGWCHCVVQACVWCGGEPCTSALAAVSWKFVHG